MERKTEVIKDYFDEPLTWETIRTDDGALFVHINTIWALRDLCECETSDHHEAFELTGDALYYCETHHK